METTYKQDIKDKSRKLIWKHAVESLTSNRHESRMLNEEYLKNLSNYVVSKSRQDLDSTELASYFQFIDISYEAKTPKMLKVAFFCGPEPENDVEVLLSLGVRLENMFAFESDKDEFQKAVSSLRGYPQLKIYNGTIENFSLMHNTIFDIIYLDFTSSLLNCYKTICSVLDNNMLAPLGILAVNTTYLDKKIESVDFLTNYFFHDIFFERCVYYGHESDRNFSDAPVFGRIEGSMCMGWRSPEDLRPFIERNFDCAYSAFQTDFINGYANIIKPSYSAFSRHIMQKRLLKMDRINEFVQNDKAYNQMDLDYFCDGLNLFSLKMRKITDKRFLEFLTTKDNGRLLSRIDSLRLWEMLTNAHYIKECDLGEVNGNGEPIYEKIDIPSFLAEPLEHSIGIIENAIKPKDCGLMFCDVPMIHLWYEMIINSLGYPYHTNVKNHIRHYYTAKTRKMCVDVFTFDQCRGFYDWLPMIEYQSDYVKDFTKQMIIRMSIDAIAKHSLGIIEQQYYGSALIGEGETKWAKYYDFPSRIGL
ncbi:MAG: hypothetical protein II937_17735 [Bacteroidales bacterium]|nr:hypothetical protein [Bacteroidales bacterium]